MNIFNIVPSIFFAHTSVGEHGNVKYCSCLVVSWLGLLKCSGRKLGFESGLSHSDSEGLIVGYCK